MFHLFGISTTLVRIVIPTLAGLGGAFGGIVGAVVGLGKLMPERAAIVVGYQADVIEGQAAEIKRLTESVAHLENRVRELEDEPRPYLA